jgi:hypothetical protein
VHDWRQMWGYPKYPRLWQVWHSDDVDCIPACCNISGTRVIPVGVAGVLAVKYRLGRESDDRSNDFDSISHVKYSLDWHDDDRSGDWDDFGDVSGNKHRIDRGESDNKAGDGEHVEVGDVMQKMRDNFNEVWSYRENDLKWIDVDTSDDAFILIGGKLYLRRL